ncbi:hypothetical protein [Pantanalinema sp. GBBB05]|uniref:hypothetical protein n=1 Tax=Pantanalinema sp. GBBB05 TaxID=2604139 RepID=UPI001DBDDB26|nr:hypothetical protein [Pantanalinema sp. GBBB05]
MTIELERKTWLKVIQIRNRCGFGSGGEGAIESIWCNVVLEDLEAGRGEAVCLLLVVERVSGDEAAFL